MNQARPSQTSADGSKWHILLDLPLTQSLGGLTLKRNATPKKGVACNHKRIKQPRKIERASNPLKNNKEALQRVRMTVINSVKRPSDQLFKGLLELELQDVRRLETIAIQTNLLFKPESTPRNAMPSMTTTLKAMVIQTKSINWKVLSQQMLSWKTRAGVEKFTWCMSDALRRLTQDGQLNVTMTVAQEFQLYGVNKAIPRYITQTMKRVAIRSQSGSFPRRSSKTKMQLLTTTLMTRIATTNPMTIIRATFSIKRRSMTTTTPEGIHTNVNMPSDDETASHLTKERRLDVVYEYRHRSSTPVCPGKVEHIP